MARSSRLFELAQILCAASQLVTAARLGATLEVSARTVYRNIAALQAMRTPVKGAVGVGCILRTTYDLPPVNFDIEEVEALRVDRSLQRAGLRVRQKLLT